MSSSTSNPISFSKPAWLPLTISRSSPMPWLEPTKDEAAKEDEGTLRKRRLDLATALFPSLQEHSARMLRMCHLPSTKLGMSKIGIPLFKSTARPQQASHDTHNQLHNSNSILFLSCLGGLSSRPVISNGVVMEIFECIDIVVPFLVSHYEALHFQTWWVVFKPNSGPKVYFPHCEVLQV